MRNIIIYTMFILTIGNSFANTVIEKKSKIEDIALEINCSAVYNASLQHLLLKEYPTTLAEGIANAARQECYDQNEKALKSNPDCN